MKQKISGFSFRVRFRRSPTDTLNIVAPRWEWHLGDATPSLVLCSRGQQEPIKDSEELVFKSQGWASEEDAALGGKKYADALMLSLARLQVGADFGSRAPKSACTRAGLANLQARTGHRVLNDVHGLMVYESEPPPRFASISVGVLRGVPQDRFERVLSRAIDEPRDLSSRERLSLDLFNASFFQNSADSRFLLLIMAIEALLKPLARSAGANRHVEALIRATQESVELAPPEKESLLACLGWLRCGSINQTGRTLARNRLGQRVYANTDAPSFFSYCYGLRSQLVHGKDPMPTPAEIGSVVGTLEVFVSDLLSGSLLEVELS